MAKMRILVLCTGNSCRSPMAEGFFRKFSDGKVEVVSAGLEPTRVNPYAIKVMKEVGIDISTHKSRHLNAFIGEPFDYVITVCDNAAANCPRFPGEGARLHWPFDDPTGAGTAEQTLAEFRRVRDEIGRKVLQWLGGLKNREEAV